ncbi:MAG: outer membrane protein assembly factor BamB [Plesiomonas sp.]
MAKRCRLLAVSLLTATLLSGCSLFSGEEDVVKVSPLPVVENQFTVQKVWDTSVGSGVGDFFSRLRPAYLDGKVYAASRSGIIEALNAETGKREWRTNIAEKSGFFSSSPSAMLAGGVTAADGVVYVASEKAEVYALNADDGAIKWVAKVAGEVLSSPAVDNNAVLVHTTNGMLQALDAEDGHIRWTANLDIPTLSIRGESSPVTAYGAVLVGGDSGRVTAIMLEQGQLIWQQRIAKAGGATEIDRLSDVDATPIVVDNVVYALAYNGDLSALDLRSGQQIWRRNFGSVNDFVIDGNTLYLVDNTGRVISVDVRGGTELWSQTGLLHRGVTAPVIYEGYLVVGDSEGYLHWLDLGDGRFVAQNKVNSSGLYAQPVVADNTLLIQTRNGDVVALKK